MCHFDTRGTVGMVGTLFQTLFVERLEPTVFDGFHAFRTVLLDLEWLEWLEPLNNLYRNRQEKAENRGIGKYRFIRENRSNRSKPMENRAQVRMNTGDGPWNPRVPNRSTVKTHQPLPDGVRLGTQEK